MSFLRLKVKVAMAEEKVEKVLIACGEDEVIDSIVSKIEDKLRGRGVKENGDWVQVMRLRVDGYDLSGEDRARDVLRDNDVLVAESYAVWLQNEVPMCFSKVWCTVSEEDFVQDKYLFACAGRNERGKIFVAGGEGPNMRAGDVSRLSLLDDTSTEPRTLFDDGGRVRATLDSSSGLTLSVKPSQAQEATVYTVDLKTGEYTKAADPQASAERSPAPDLPRSLRQGPSFPDQELEEKVPEPPGENEIVAEGGDPDVVIALDHKVNTEVYQSTKQPGDVLVQFVAFNFQIFNKKSEDYEIADVTIQASPEGKKEVRLADRGAPCYYQFRPHRSFKVEARSHEIVSVVYTIEVKDAKVWDTQARRLHHSMQSGFEATIGFAQFDGSSHAVKVNVPPRANLMLPDPTNVLKAVDCPELVGFAYCDDLEASERLAIAIGLAKDGTFFKVTRLPNRGLHFGGQHYIRHNYLAKLAYQAGDDGEIRVKELCYEDKSSMAGKRKAECVALVHQKQVYALKLTLETNTGKTVEYVKLPSLKI